MDPLLDAKFGNVDIECSVENADNLSLTYDRTIAVREVGDEDTQEQMGRLFLREPGRILLTGWRSGKITIW